MPHSSGGGSSSGGSHGGSSHGGSNGGSLGRTSRRPFPGGYPYSYRRFGMMRTVYIAKNPHSAIAKAEYYSSIFGVVAIGVFALFMVFALLVNSGKLDLSAPLELPAKYEIVIEDDAGVLGDTGMLISEMKEFAENTGVIPAIVTDYNESWRAAHTDAEGYAYDKYLELFEDEDHWLILYTRQQNPEAESIDWYWEGMQGNNTDDALNQGKINAFNRAIQEGLENGDSLEDVLYTAYKGYNDGNTKIYVTDIIGPALACAFLLFAFVGSIGNMLIMRSIVKGTGIVGERVRYPGESEPEPQAAEASSVTATYADAESSDSSEKRKAEKEERDAYKEAVKAEKAERKRFGGTDYEDEVENYRNK